MIGKNNKSFTSFEIFYIMIDDDPNNEEDKYIFDKEDEADEDEEEEEDSEQSEYHNVSFVCEDCSYRWDLPTSSDEEEMEGEPLYCPMCGNTNVIQI